MIDRVAKNHSMQTSLIHTLGLIASILLPLFNLPLIYRLWQRKSSEDISLTWVFGVFICMIFMLPAALVSPDVIYKVFGIMNLVFFTFVTVLVVYYRVKK